MMLQPHEERVVIEKRELDEKISKLQVFITSPVFNGLDIHDRNDLEEQYYVMISYSKILDSRIGRFPK